MGAAIAATLGQRNRERRRILRPKEQTQQIGAPKLAAIWVITQNQHLALRELSIDTVVGEIIRNFAAADSEGRSPRFLNPYSNGRSRLDEDPLKVWVQRSGEFPDVMRKPHLWRIYGVVETCDFTANPIAINKIITVVPMPTGLGSQNTASK